ncbi:hypothetical protein GCM10009872_13090 [Actinopolymorpha rutila]
MPTIAAMPVARETRRYVPARAPRTVRSRIPLIGCSFVVKTVAPGPGGPADLKSSFSVGPAQWCELHLRGGCGGHRRGDGPGCAGLSGAAGPAGWPRSVPLGLSCPPRRRCPAADRSEDADEYTADRRAPR